MDTLRAPWSFPRYYQSIGRWFDLSNRDQGCPNPFLPCIKPRLPLFRFVDSLRITDCDCLEVGCSEVSQGRFATLLCKSALIFSWIRLGIPWSIFKSKAYIGKASSARTSVSKLS